jgi:hypothetical protein
MAAPLPFINLLIIMMIPRTVSEEDGSVNHVVN